MTIVTDYRSLLSGSYWYPVPAAQSPLVAAGQPIVLSYSFSQAPTSSQLSLFPAAAATFQPFSASDEAIARSALAQWSAASGITFIETTQAEGDITFGYYSLATMGYSGSVGLGYYPDSMADISSSGYPEATGGQQPVAGDVYVDTSYAGNAGLQTDLAHVLVHEIGHAIGLKHPFDAGAYTLDPSLDNGDETVMSYTGARNATLGPLDVAAASYLYGNFGDTPNSWTWSWNPTSETYTVHAVGDDVFVHGIGAKSDVVYAPGLHDAVVTQQGNDVIYADGQPISVNAGAGYDTVYTGLTFAGLLGGVGRSGDFTYIYVGGDYQTYYSVESLVFTDGIYSTATSSFTAQSSLAIAALSAVKPEGNSGSTPFTFTVTRGGSTAAAGTVVWALTGLGPHPAGPPDFAGGVVPGGTLSFAPGQISQIITVNIAGDTLAEPDEGFRVVLSGASAGIVITTGTADATILNDDTNFAVAAVTGSRPEGNSGATPFLFTVTRSGVTSGSNSVAWSTAGAAPNSVGPLDFVGGVAPSGTLSFAPGVTSQTITVNVQGDTLLEPDEYFKVQLGAATGGAVITGASALSKIVNDDTAFSIAADVAAQAEGNSGSTPFTFTVTRTGNIAGTHSIGWLASGAQPNSVGPADFVTGTQLSGGLIFLPGEVTKTITVQVQGDTLVEPDEHFMVLLRNASAGAAISVNNAEVTVLNDDGAPPAPDAGAVPLAQADFNGDGALDSLRSGADGTLFLLGGASGVQAALTRSAVGMSFVGAADFTGHGTSALLLEGAGGGLYEWTLAGAKVVQSDLIAHLGAGLSVAAVRDFTGDGRADILLHDTTAGAADAWVLLAMDGAAVAGRTGYASPLAAWHLG